MTVDPFFEEPGTDPLWVPPEDRGQPGTAVGEFIITHRRAHQFVKRPGGKRGCGFQLTVSEECGAAKADPRHVGVPPSLNVFGSGANRFKYQGDKQLWESILTGLMSRAKVPKPLGAVYAEARVCFPDRRQRDQGNFRFILEKALGDALQKGGWLEKDDWDHYEFGNLARTYRKGESFTQVIIMPTWAWGPDGPPEPPEDSGAGQETLRV